MSIAAPILEPPAYAHVFTRWRGAKACEFWGPGNVGDLLIRRGAEQIYAAYGITLCGKDETPDVVVYGGGGNMEPLYPGTRLTRLDARATATALGVPLIVLPQSWTGPEDFDAEQFFARQNRSIHSLIKKRYRVGKWELVLIGRFDDLCALLQSRIDGTMLGRINQSKRQKSYSTLAEYRAEHFAP